MIFNARVCIICHSLTGIDVMDGKTLVYDGNDVQSGIDEPCTGFILPNCDTPKEAIVRRE